MAWVQALLPLLQYLPKCRLQSRDPHHQTFQLVTSSKDNLLLQDITSIEADKSAHFNIQLTSCELLEYDLVHYIGKELKERFGEWFY